MMLSRHGRRGHAVVALAAAILVSSVPVRAEAPQPEADGLSLPIVTTPEMRADDAAEKLKGVSVLFEHVGEGEASYYGHELAGNRTASGERFNPNGLTAAHRTLPLGTKLRVTSKKTGKSVIVRVNDRGPFVGRRVLDLSLAAAKEIGLYRAGKGLVTMELLR